jgi:hypothetical protein
LKLDVPLPLLLLLPPQAAMASVAAAPTAVSPMILRPFIIRNASAQI